MASHAEREISVVGGGLAGLVAAVSCAERGAAVRLLEATSKLGGRARSLEHDGFITNQGPHALYAGGPGWQWLRARHLLPETVKLPPTSVRMRYGGRTRTPPLRFLRAGAALREPAPHDVSLDEWLRRRTSPEVAQAAAGYLTLPTFDGAPGRHAASYGQEMWSRTTASGAVHYVAGGWGQLVSLLVDRAEALGVQVELGHRAKELPEGDAVIVCTGPRAAAALLADPTLEPDGQSVALWDIALRIVKPHRRGPAAVFELDEGVYVARYTARDRSLAPDDHDLLQCCAGLRPGEDASTAHDRIGHVLDAVIPGWTERVIFDRRYRTLSPGFRDPVGSTMSDRPAIERGGRVYLAGDYVAAPGILSEVSFSSAAAASAAALGIREGRHFDVST
jgi:phytoene dehydrogenase-like protein